MHWMGNLELLQCHHVCRGASVQYTQLHLMLLFCVTRPSLQYWEIGLVPATAAGCSPQCNPIKMNSDYDQPLSIAVLKCHSAHCAFCYVSSFYVIMSCLWRAVGAHVFQMQSLSDMICCPNRTIYIQRCKGSVNIELCVLVLVVQLFLDSAVCCAEWLSDYDKTEGMATFILQFHTCSDCLFLDSGIELSSQLPPSVRSSLF